MTHRLSAWEGHNTEYWRRAWQVGAIHLFDTVDSTNDIAAELAASGAPHFTVVMAEEQTRGRGRAGSRWQAERATSLLFSVLLRIEHEAPTPGCAPIRTGLAVAEAIERSAGAGALVKWPNDVVFQNHGKVAGILCEGAFGQQGPGYVIVGIGINVLQAQDHFAHALRGAACSVLSATGMRVERSELLSDVLANLHSFGDRIAQPLSASELDRIARRDILRNHEIVCETGAEKPVLGMGRGIAHDGALLVEQNGGLIPVYSATVRFTRSHTYPGSSRG